MLALDDSRTGLRVEHGPELWMQQADMVWPYTHSHTHTHTVTHTHRVSPELGREHVLRLQTENAG